MKYQYRLVKENEEEESGLKGFRAQNKLFLIALKDGRANTAEELLNIIKNPKYLSGKETAFSKNDPELKELEERVFGPSGKVSTEKYIEIYQANGPNLYRTIAQEIRGFQPGQKEEILDKNGQRVAVFPKKTAENLAIVSEFFTKKMGKEAKKTSVRPEKVMGEFILRFPLSDGIDLEKILNNAGLKSGTDYKLERHPEDFELKDFKIDENLHKIVREEILKYYKK